MPGGSNDVLFGSLVGDPDSGYTDLETEITIFTQRFYIRMEAFSVGDMPGVDRVYFRIYDADTGELVHERREGTYGYCAFGNGEPICDYLELAAGATWPETGIPIENGLYRVEADVYLEGDPDGSPRDQWNATFRIDAPALGPTVGPQLLIPFLVLDLRLELAETFPGEVTDMVRDKLTFRVTAWDPTVGPNDGDGIDNVTMQIFGPLGLVHERIEADPGWCAFGNGRPNCEIWNFGDNGYRWPSGAEIIADYYTLRATARADDGRTLTGEWTVYLE